MLAAPFLGRTQGLENKVDAGNDKKPNPSFAGLSFTTSFRDSYTAPVGFTVDSQNGPVNQTLIQAGINDLFKKGDNASVFTWADYDFGYGRHGKAALDEQDIGISYALPLGKVFGGDLSANTSVQYWKYWTGNLGEHDIVTDLNFSWTGPITLDVMGRQLWAHQGVEDGRYVILQASKQMSLEKILPKVMGWNFAVTPSLSSAFNNNFYIEGNRWMGVIAKGTISATKRNASISAGAGYIHSFNRGPIEKSHSMWELTFSYNFK
jgi:hypothetical protein